MRRRASTVSAADLQQALAMSSFDAVQAQMDDRHRWMVTKLKVRLMRQYEQALLFALHIHCSALIKATLRLGQRQ